MTPIEICLVIVGAILFVGSFFVTEKLTNRELRDIGKLGAEEINIILSKELDQAGERARELMDAALEESLPGIERPLERVTNEKIMAISEYSDTVLKEIQEKHTELMFLYSMLNGKEEELKKVSNAVDRSKAHVKEMLQELIGLTNRLEAQSVRFQERIQAEGREDAEEEREESQEEETLQDGQGEDAENDPEGESELQFVLDGEKENSNDMILALYQEGKTVRDIAKELSLGIGEVKLVVDLYKGGKQ